MKNFSVFFHRLVLCFASLAINSIINVNYQLEFHKKNLQRARYCKKHTQHHLSQNMNETSVSKEFVHFCFNYQRAFVVCKNEQLKQKTATQVYFKKKCIAICSLFFYRCVQFEFVVDLCYEISVLDSSTIIFILYPLTCNYEFHVSLFYFIFLY